MDFLELARELHGCSEAIYPLGFASDSWTDRLKVDLRTKVLRTGLPIVKVIETLEKYLQFVRDRVLVFRTTNSEYPFKVSIHSKYPFIRSCLDILKCLCTLHHVLLHRYYYTEIRSEQSTMLSNLCLVGSTVSYAHKLVGQRTCWSKAFRNFNYVLAIIDEIQALGKIEVAGACACFGGCIAAGDDNQDLNDFLMKPNVSEEKALKHPAAMLRKRSIIAWGRRNTCVQVLDNAETLRYGEPKLGFLKQLFPFLDNVTTRSRRTTHFLPIFFQFPIQLAHGTDAGEISRERSIFVSLLVLLSLEVVVALQTPKRNVLVICYLTRVRDDLRSFLRYALSPMCMRWHARLNLGPSPSHSYQFVTLEKEKLLSVVGPFRCKGIVTRILGFCSAFWIVFFLLLLFFSFVFVVM